MKKIFYIAIAILLLCGAVAFSQDVKVQGKIVTDSLTVGTVEWNKLLTRINVLEGADLTAPAVDSAYIRFGLDSVIFVYFDEELGESGNDSVDYSFSYAYGE